MSRNTRRLSLGWGTVCLALALARVMAASPVAESPQLVSRRGPAVPTLRTGAGMSLSTSSSRDGRYVVFQSTAPDLIAGSSWGPGWEVFRRDLVALKTERVSTFSTVGGGVPVSPAPSISHDGGSVAFVSHRTVSLGGDTNGVADVFVRRMTRGEPELVSIRFDGSRAGNAASGPAQISGDGRFVVFESLATDLVSGVDTNGVGDVFLRELEAGSTVLLSARPTDSQTGDGRSYGPLMSADASVVLFRSSATDITPGFSNNSTDLFIWTRADRTLKRLSLPGGIVARPPQFVHITNPVLSEEGRFLAFRATTSGTTVTALDGVWVWDLSAGTGVLARNDRAGTGVLGQDDLSGPVMSRDGQILAFEVNEGVVTRPTRKIKAWTAATGLQSLESLVTGDPATAPDPESSEMPVLDADGSRLAFPVPKCGSRNACDGVGHESPVRPGSGHGVHGGFSGRRSGGSLGPSLGRVHRRWLSTGLSVRSSAGGGCRRCQPGVGCVHRIPRHVSGDGDFVGG
jgi:Tol biopolymer transport system component